MNSLSNLLTEISARLEPVSQTAVLDSQVLLAHILGKPRAWIIAHPEIILSPEQTHQLEIATSRLEQGEPLPYVLGHWEFYGLDFEITPDVLIPRPETESLVERALDWLRANPDRHQAAEVGTGSGCIAISIGWHINNLQIVAGDISPQALKLAQRNAIKHGLAAQIHFVHSDLLLNINPIQGERFDLICANLPYIPSDTLKSLKVSQWEPQIALNGGRDGLDLFRRLLRQAAHKIALGGLLLLETEATLGYAARSLAEQAFPQASITLQPDLAGNNRVLVVELPAA